MSWKVEWGADLGCAWEGEQLLEAGAFLLQHGVHLPQPLHRLGHVGGLRGLHMLCEDVPSSHAQEQAAVAVRGAAEASWGGCEGVEPRV